MAADFITAELEAVLARFGALAPLLAGAAIQGVPRNPVAPLVAFRADDGQSVPLWMQRRRGRRTRLVTAGLALAAVPSQAEIDRAMALIAQSGAPDVVHMFVTVPALPKVLPTLTSAGATCRVRRTSYRYVLPLGDDYEAFVQGLGKHTRRNIRLYQREAEAAGLAFSYARQAPRTSAEAVAERAAVGRMTLPKPKSEGRLGELDSYLRLRRRPFHSVIRTGEGTLLSVATGFQAGDAAYLVYQANDKAHLNANLALTHRSHLIRALIADGVRTFVFPNGVNDVLRNACRRDLALELLALRDGYWAGRRIERWLSREPTHPAARFYARETASAVPDVDAEVDADATAG